MLNLDCETDERLRRVRDALSRALRRLREREESYRAHPTKGGPIGAPAIKRSNCSYLLQYVNSALEARAARLAGYIGAAQRHEDRCDRIYKYYLPPQLKW